VRANKLLLLPPPLSCSPSACRYNLYVWTLAFVYAPLQSGAGVYSQDFDSMDGDSVSDGSMMGAGEDAIVDMQLCMSLWRVEYKV
jgi:hypothetical protein